MQTESLHSIKARDTRVSIQSLWVNLKERKNSILEIELDKKTSAYHGLLVFPLISFVILTNLTIILIPRNDFNELNYLEIFIQEFIYFLNSSFLAVLGNHFEFLLLMGKTDACKGRNVFCLYLGLLIVPFTYKFTTIIIRKNNLIPGYSKDLSRLLAVILIDSTKYIIIWLQHPKSQRSNPNFRRRYRWYLLFKVLCIFFTQGYIQTARLFDKIVTLYQIPLAFMLLGMRYVASKSVKKVTEKARGENESSASFAVDCGVGCMHALFLVLIIGSKSRIETTIVYALIDTLLIIRLFNKTLSAVKDQASQDGIDLDAILQTLTLKETLEILVPICFCPIYIMAFLGPNKESIHLVKDKEIDGILRTVTIIGIFMVYDGIRIWIFAVLLKKRYHISLFQSYCKLMNVYWKLITVFIAGLIFLVSK